MTAKAWALSKQIVVQITGTLEFEVSIEKLFISGFLINTHFKLNSSEFWPYSLRRLTNLNARDSPRLLVKCETKI